METPARQRRVLFCIEAASGASLVSILLGQLFYTGEFRSESISWSHPPLLLVWIAYWVAFYWHWRPPVRGRDAWRQATWIIFTASALWVGAMAGFSYVLAALSEPDVGWQEFGIQLLVLLIALPIIAVTALVSFIAASIVLAPVTLPSLLAVRLLLPWMNWRLRVDA